MLVPSGLDTGHQLDNTHLLLFVKIPDESCRSRMHYRKPLDSELYFWLSSHLHMGYLTGFRLLSPKFLFHEGPL